ncbi:MAG: PLDc N-terminal domain-containing protein [Myxococcales bacterium]|nr:PLDc N-terminal domain-containing protein [Myxococcales bacterium]
MDEIPSFVHWSVAGAALLAAFLVSLHALASRRDPRSAVGWIALAWLSPIVGAFLYLVFGINRVRRRALGLRAAFLRDERARSHGLDPEALGEMAPLARAIGSLSPRPLAPGNEVTALANGDEGYPAMLTAIRGAKRFVVMQSYIFEGVGPGARFVDALADAVARGVAVRVLVDAAGERYGAPRITRLLARRKVPVRRFLPAFPPWRWPYVNLRNHRKILVVDGEVAFTGGLNVRPGHVLTDEPTSPTRDYHFRFRGPVVEQLFEAFVDDWRFATGETLSGPAWGMPDAPNEPFGDACCRVVTDGPDDDMDMAWLAMFAGLAQAKERVVVLTPYFLPDPPLVAALEMTARRGVRVDVVLPGKSNLRFVDWAMQHLLDRGLHGVNVWRTSAPFDHSKLLVVDGVWSLVGSANWDPRSLRLNFEVLVEAYDRELAQELLRVADARIGTASPHTRESRLLPRYRNAAVFLAQPLL